MKNGYSRKGLFGSTIHYDENGKVVGKSRPGLFGSTNHYDNTGRYVGKSRPGLFDTQNHYDTDGNKLILISSSVKLRIFAIFSYLYV